MSWASDEFPRIRARLMAAAMQPIERQAAEATVEIVELESWLNDDAECESKHRETDCTVEVTHVVRCCRRVHMVCADSADWHSRGMKEGYYCSGCKKLCAECWRVVPV